MNIYAKILADSINSSGNRMTTFEIQMPKVLLAEMNTHKMVSKNFQSSRAVPTGRMNEIESFEPLYFGKNQPGMAASLEEVDDVTMTREVWNSAVEYSKIVAQQLANLGLAKQWSNRVNDWHVMAKGVISATEWSNFLWLRLHAAAQPEFRELAICIDSALRDSTPVLLQPGQWHLPYVETAFDDLNEEIGYFDSERRQIDLETAKKISGSCCAQVSYRRLDESVEKSLDIYNKLVGADRLHASPFEHQATPIPESFSFINWPAGVSHMDRNANFWSGNLQGWIQNRKLMPNENHTS